MPGMFRVIAFLCLLIAFMCYWGELMEMALIFFAQTAFFGALSFFRLSERMYLNIFNAYIVLFFVVFIYYIFFQQSLTGPVAH